MLIRKNWGEHLRWIVGVIAASVATVLLYVTRVNETGWERRPTGSTGWLFWFGVAGGSICLFEFLLWPRKKVRTWRIGQVQTWMKAHIWLGLLAVPLLLFHSGFYFHNLEATILFALFVIVILSGVWGLILQQYLPEKLLREVPVETIFSQIPHMANLLIVEGDHIVSGTCGVSPTGEKQPEALVTAVKEEAEFAAALRGEFHVGSVRYAAGGAQAKLMQSRVSVEPVPESEPLRHFFYNVLVGYLRNGKKSGSDLADDTRAKAAFTDLRLKLDPRAHPAADELEKLAGERRQLDHQMALHFWLHNWLWVHLPLSVALIILMFVHVFKTLQYLWPA